MSTRNRVEFPIYVPTKGRWDIAAIPGVLEEAGLKYTLVVEPQDKKKYEKRCRKDWSLAKIVVLPRDNRGPNFVRQFILEHARKRGVERFWSIDDSVRDFLEVVGGKLIHTTIRTALAYSEKIIKIHLRVAMLGLQFRQFAWSAKKAYQFNRMAYACCTLVITSTDVNYDVDVYTKGDIDLMCQHFLVRWRTILVNRYCIGRPPMCSGQKGGNLATYKSGKINEVSKKLVKKYPKFLSPFNKKTGLDVRFDWKYVDSLFVK